MNYADTHAHLSDKAFDSDRAESISSAIGLNVNVFFEILCSPKDWNKDVLFSNYKENFYFAYGIHPEYAGEYLNQDLIKLEEKLKDGKSVFLGEIGLDYYWVNDNKEKQFKLLRNQLKISERLSMPCVFHCRNGKNAADNAYADLLGFLEKEWNYNSPNKKRGILHSFSGGDDDAKRALDLNLYLGINGTFTYPKNKELREIVKKAGPDNIVYETDCPYLPPQSLRGKRNSSSNIPEISYEISSYCGFAFKESAEKIYNNSLSFIK